MKIKGSSELISELHIININYFSTISFFEEEKSLVNIL